jgi:hypothetical protein
MAKGPALRVLCRRRSAVAFYHPVAEPDDPVGVIGDIFFMGDEDNGVACGLDAGKDIHDLDGGLGIEVTGRLVGQDQGGLLMRARAMATRWH